MSPYKLAKMMLVSFQGKLAILASKTIDFTKEGLTIFETKDFIYRFNHSLIKTSLENDQNDLQNILCLPRI